MGSINSLWHPPTPQGLVFYNDYFIDVQIFKNVKIFKNVHISRLKCEAEARAGKVNEWMNEWKVHSLKLYNFYEWEQSSNCLNCHDCKKCMVND